MLDLQAAAQRVASTENAVSVKGQKMSFPYNALQINPDFVSSIGDKTESIRSRKSNSSH